MDMNKLLDVFEGALPLAVHRTVIWSVLVALDHLHKSSVVHTGQSSTNYGLIDDKL